jgi:hypothetical protein
MGALAKHGSLDACFFLVVNALGKALKLVKYVSPIPA